MFWETYLKNCFVRFMKRPFCPFLHLFASLAQFYAKCQSRAADRSHGTVAFPRRTRGVFPGDAAHVELPPDFPLTNRFYYKKLTN